MGVVVLCRELRGLHRSLLLRSMGWPPYMGEGLSKHSAPGLEHLGLADMEEVGAPFST